MLQFQHMKNTKESLVIANWKMNPMTVLDAKNICTTIKATAKKYPHAMIVVAPPTLFMLECKKILGASSVKLGAQTMHQSACGAQTGEIGTGMLTAAGVSFVILGHSERRALGETDAAIGVKVLAALKARLTPVICIGEKERDSQGNFYTHIEAQIKSALTLIPKARFKDVVIAYEPIWAIGTGLTANVDDVYEMKLFIHKVLSKQFDRSAANRVRIIYGGSVTAENATQLYAGGGIDGFLVGGASLKPIEFTKIIAATV